MRSNPWDVAFTTNATQMDSFLGRVQSLLSKDDRKPLYVLDVGCGDGGKAFRLTELWPGCHITGVDISEQNIRLAEMARQSHPAKQRLRFLAGDYMTLALGRYDLILADGVLHLIPHKTEALFAKLVSELNVGGQLLFTMPYTSWYNSLLNLTRRTFRQCRCRIIDSLILTLAKFWHGKTYSPEFLKERLHYAYFLPYRMGSQQLQQELTTHHHLTLQEVQPYAHTSPGQLKHRLWSYRYLPQCKISA